jgi:hypothetical protein
VGEGTSLALAEVLQKREALATELVRLEASARAAVDIPAKIKREPVKTAGLAAGAAFIVVGGPRRLFRRAKRIVRGPEAPLPTSMLPKEIDESLKGLGTDGERVRGLIEREFAAYLRDHGPERQRRELSRTGAVLLVAALRPFVLAYGKKAAAQIFATDTKAYEARLEQVRARMPGDATPAKTGDEGPTTP